MKRPLMIVGFTVFASLAVFSHFKSIVAVALFFPALIISAALIAVWKKANLKVITIILVSFTVAAGMFVVQRRFVAEKFKPYDGETQKVCGYVSHVDDDGYVFKGKIDGQSVKIYIWEYGTPFVEVGESYTAELTLEHMDSLEKTYQQTRCLSAGCFLSATAPAGMFRDDTVTAGFLENMFFRLRNKILKVQKDVFHRSTAGFISAITLGDRRMLSDDVTSVFRRAGLSHVLAISGMHLSILGQILFLLLKFWNERKAAAVAFVFTLFYMTLTGFERSVVRAGIMAMILYFAMLLFQDYDALTSVGAACLIMCLFNPGVAADTSLQLSLISTVGIIVLNKPIIGRFENFRRNQKRFVQKLLFPLNAFLVSICANIALIPMYFYVFKTFSTVGIFANIPAAILMPVILFFAFFATLIGCCPIISGAACLPGFVADVSSILFTRICRWFAGFKYALIDIRYPFLSLWVLATAVLLLIAALDQQKPKPFLTAGFLSLILLFSTAFCYNVIDSESVSVRVAPAGKNGCVLVNSRGQYAVVCDIKTNDDVYGLQSALTRACVTEVDLLIVPEYAGRVSLLNFIKNYKIPTVIYNKKTTDSTVVEALENTGCTLYSLENGLQASMGRVKFEIYEYGETTDILMRIDQVEFNLNRGAFDLYHQYRACKDSDILFVGNSVPNGSEHLKLSYVLLTNPETFHEMRLKTVGLARYLGYLDEDTEILFTVNENEYSVREVN